jgi:hypothetical protein
MKRIILFFALSMAICGFAFAQDIKNNANSNHANKFEQLGTILPTPNEQRTASGAPGPKYWQMRADYDIKCTLDEVNNKLTGSETITYYNNSPDVLNYLWLQLDENQHSTTNNANYQSSNPMQQIVTDKALDRADERKSDNGYGFNITKLTDITGKPLKYVINKTMMKVDLLTPLKPGQKVSFNLDWNYKLANRSDFNRFGGARGGYEPFEDGNNNYTITQWYPRMCKYGDEIGWQNHQFTGTGEFTLSFGNFKVQMTVPADHIVGGTGECQNYAAVLSPTQMARWQKAQNADQPVQMVTLDEALNASKVKTNPKTKTWIYKADNVRDFAWTSSRRFVWDAMKTMVNGKKVMSMSYYAKEAYPIYSKFSTKAVAHTIKTYSDFSIPYPYPVAISVEGNQGMEYPMISFNPGRAEKDGSYNEGQKNAAIFVIIHEVGHTFFPMIINSDERQWTWMDEGLNSYVQYLTQELWDNKFPSHNAGGGPAWAITDYMKLPKDQLEPIMTNSENINNFGANAYAKVATGLNILRETIVGRELFDNAFREYARRWAFKHPTPADLFRTLEDATGEDLDWFWRGWFYGTDNCDISIDTVKHAKADVTATPPQTKDTIVMRPLPGPQVGRDDISKMRNREDKNIKFETDRDTALRDFYWRYGREMEKVDTTKYPVLQRAGLEQLDAEGQQKYGNKNMYEITFSNKGGLVMPIILEWTYKDGTKEVERIPAQVWRKNENKVIKTFVKDKEVASVKLDPFNETADTNTANNTYGDIKEPSKFKVFKQKQFASPAPGINPMQKAAEKKAF